MQKFVFLPYTLILQHRKCNKNPLNSIKLTTLPEAPEDPLVDPPEPPVGPNGGGPPLGEVN